MHPVERAAGAALKGTRFSGPSVEVVILDGPGGALVDEFGDFFWCGPIRVQPLALDIGDEDVGTIQHTMAGMDAFSGFETDHGPLAAGLFNLREPGVSAFPLSAASYRPGIAYNSGPLPCVLTATTRP